MSKAYAVPICFPQFPAEASFGGRRRRIATSLRIGRAAREVWTLKAAANLSAITGYSPRACEAWISPTNPTVIPGDALADLIRCEFGQRFLAAIMEDAAPPWWRIAQQVFALIGVFFRQQSVETELKAALNVDAELRVTIARSAALLSASDGAGASDHGVRHGRRASDRAVASPAGRGRQ